MGIFDDWAVKRKPFRVVVISGAMLALFVGFFADIEKLSSFLISKETRYDVQVEIQPVHVMFGRIDVPLIYRSDPEHPQDLSTAALWVANTAEAFIKERGFGEVQSKIYEIAIDDAQLVLTERSAGDTAYMYEIFTELGWFVDDGFYGTPSMYEGVADGTVPNFFSAA